MRTNHLIGVGVVFTGVALAVALVRAGDLNPPAGPVAPTMTDLQDIQTSLDNIGAAVNVPTPAWDYAFASFCCGGDNVLVTGSGVLHAVLVTAADTTGTGVSVRIFDSTSGPTTQIATAATSPLPSSAWIPLNVRFENGLNLVNISTDTARATVFYRLDPAS